MSEGRRITLSQEMLEDSICNLSAYKEIMQERFKKMNYEGKGELDAMEFGRDIGIAIDSMKILLSSFPVSRDTPGIDREYNEVN